MWQPVPKKSKFNKTMPRSPYWKTLFCFHHIVKNTQFTQTHTNKQLLPSLQIQKFVHQRFTAWIIAQKHKNRKLYAIYKIYSLFSSYLCSRLLQLFLFAQTTWINDFINHRTMVFRSELWFQDWRMWPRCMYINNNMFGLFFAALFCTADIFL